MFTKILVADRGASAVRIVRACRRMGIPTLAVCSTADRNALHAVVADERVCVGPSAFEHSYLSAPAIVGAGLSWRADAVHPGGRFHAQNGDFAEACERSGLTFIGPRVRNLRLMSDRGRARRLAERAGVPIVPGSAEALADLAGARAVADAIGFPVAVRPAVGAAEEMVHVADDHESLEAAFLAARARGDAAYGNNLVHVERHVEGGRRVRVQVLADRHRHVVALGERACTVRVRARTLCEEAPVPGLEAALRERLGDAAVRITEAIGYTNVGSVEFLIDPHGGLAFVKMNTCLEVGSTLAEVLTGIDLVRQGIRSAAELPLEVRHAEAAPAGHAIACRIHAERPVSPRPPAGRVLAFHAPGGMGIRVEAGVAAGNAVPLRDDPLLATVLAHGTTRAQALARLRVALDELVIEGVETDLARHRRALADPEFLRGVSDSRYLAQHETPGRAAS